MTIHPVTDDDRWRVEQGDCLAVLAHMEPDSVDCVVTDPPYGLSDEPDIAEVLTHWLAGDDYKHRGGGFMGRTWDSFVPGPAVWRECLRVLKPGGFLLSFGGTRTADMLTTAIRLAGFEIRDRVLTLNGDVLGAEVDWVYGSGWPKSRNIGKAIDDAAGATREVVGTKPGYALKASPSDGATPIYGGGRGIHAAPDSRAREAEITAPATPEGAQWEGYGTALKPAHEPIVVARKPFRGAVEAQVLATGTGAMNIDACRITMNGERIHDIRSNPANRRGVVGEELQATGDAERNAEAQAASIARANALGRWPANVALVHAPECERVGTRRVPTGTTVRRHAGPEDLYPQRGYSGGLRRQGGEDVTYGDGDGLETIDAWDCAPGCPVAMLDDLSGELSSGVPTAVGDAAGRITRNAFRDELRPAGTPLVGYGDTGGASRFFYSGKTSPLEREAGLDDLPVAGRTDDAWGTMQTPTLDRAAPREVWAPREVRNRHPTVKPIDLMRWLIRLVTPPQGVVLDPFAGSGSTGCAAALEGTRFVGIEQDESFATIARARIAYWAGFPVGTPTVRILAQEAARRRDVADSEEHRRELAATGQLDLLAGTEEPQW